MITVQWEEQRRSVENVPCHTADLEVAQVRAIFLLGLPRELAREELDGAHRGDEVVDVVLCKVATNKTPHKAGFVR
jgi:hypothetical protein